MARRLEGRPAQACAVVVFGLISILLLLQTLHKASRPGGYDFTSYLASAQALWHRENPYHVHSNFPYIYPLCLAFLLGPFTVVPAVLAQVLWFALSLASLLWSIHILVDLNADRIGTHWRNELFVPFVLLFILLLGPIQNNLLNGQVNAIVLLLCVLFLKSYLRGSLKSAAAYLGLSAAIKLVPLVFLLFLLVRREMRMVLLVLLWCVLFCLLPVAVAGTNAFVWTLDYLDQFALKNVVSPSMDSVYFTPAGFLGRLVPAIGGDSWLVALSAGAVVLALVILDRDPRRAEASAWNFNLYLLAILLLSPMSERHHLLFLVPPAVLTSVGLWSNPAWRTRGAWAAWFAFWLLLFGGGVDKHGPFYFLAVVVLFGLTAWWGAVELRSARESAPGTRI